MARAKEAITLNFDEKLRKSVAKVKSLMVITYQALTEDQVGITNNIYSVQYTLTAQINFFGPWEVQRF